MKLNKLRNIIRETIKEQTSSGNYHKWRFYSPQNVGGGCIGQWSKVGLLESTPYPGVLSEIESQALYQALGSPSIGEFSGFPQSSNDTNNPGGGINPYWCIEYDGIVTNFTPQYGNHFLITLSDVSNFTPPVSDCNTCQNYNTQNPPTGCPTCIPSDWPNHSNWISTWTSLPNFTSSNPNQPCNMICSRITYWENKCQNVGPNHQNQLACKIAEGQNQASIHGCNC